MEWADRVDQLLYDGETEQRRVAVGAATLVVTSHRVLGFTPDGSHRYRSVDRPNVDTVSVESTGSLQYLCWTVVLACLAIGGAVTALSVSFTSLVAAPDLEGESGTADDPGAVGTDIATESIDTIESMLSLLDLAVVAGSALSIGLAAVCVALYTRSRSRQLVIRVRGEDDLEVPLGTDTVGTTAIELQNAIRPGPTLENDAAIDSLLDGESTRTEPDASTGPDAPPDPGLNTDPGASTDPDLSTDSGANTEPGASTGPPPSTAPSASIDPSTSVGRDASTSEAETRSADRETLDAPRERVEPADWTDDGVESDREWTLERADDRSFEEPFDLARGDGLDAGGDLDAGDDRDAGSDPDAEDDGTGDAIFDLGPADASSEQPDDGFDLESAATFDPGRSDDREERTDSDDADLPDGDGDGTIGDSLDPTDDGGFDGENERFDDDGFDDENE